MNKINFFANVNTYASQNFKIKDNNTPEELPENLQRDLNKMSVLGKSQIQFKGKSFKLNKDDLLFAGSIAAAFGLSADILNKVKDTIANFLQSNNYTSMSDIGGEENMDLQCDLTEKINDIIDLDDENYEILVNKIVDRCDSEFGYDPDFSETDNFEQSIKNTIKKSKENDEKFIQSLILTFELNPEEQQNLRNIISDALKEHNLPSLKALTRDISFKITDEILDKITESLNLSLGQEGLLTAELERRIAFDDTQYTPKINPLDRNIEKSIKEAAAINKITSKYDIAPFDTDRLIVALKNDAYKNGFTSIFDLFNGQNIENYTETNSVLSSRDFEQVKTDLLIDFHITAKNQTNIYNQMEKESHERALQYLKNCAIICILDDTFNFSQADLQKLQAYFKAVKPDLKTENNIWKTAYEISEIFKISGTETAKLIKKACEISEEELQDYNIKYAYKLIDKK